MIGSFLVEKLFFHFLFRKSRVQADTQKEPWQGMLTAANSLEEVIGKNDK